MAQSTRSNRIQDTVVTRRHSARGRAVRFGRKFLLHLILIVGAIAVMVPFFWMVTSSLKPDYEIFQMPPTWLPEEPLWGNYYTVLTGQRVVGETGDAGTSRAGQGWSFLGFGVNTVYITVMVLIGRLLTASLAAYAFARLRFPGRNVLFVIMLSTMMIPSQVTMIPIYMIWRNLRALDTYIPLIVPTWFGGGAFFVFLLRQFIMSIPHEYDDAARIDGCGWLGIYWRIILPMAKPALGTVAIFSFMGSWNDFMGPLIYLTTMTKYTLSIGLYFFVSQASGAARPLWNLRMAASVLAMIPPLLLFFFAQRLYIQGVVVSGVKG